MKATSFKIRYNGEIYGFLGYLIYTAAGLYECRYVNKPRGDDRSLIVTITKSPKKTVPNLSGFTSANLSYLEQHVY